MRSDLTGFYDLPIEQRLAVLTAEAGLTDGDLAVLRACGALDLATANLMLENVVGTAHLPLGIATYFRVNGRDVLVPMALEEPSVVAAASHAAKLCRDHGGFVATASDPVMTGQIQLLGARPDAEQAIAARADGIRALANSQDSTLIKRGGGLVDVTCHRRTGPRGDMLVVHLHVDVRDAMGANAVNTMCESVAPLLEDITGGRANMAIITNLADRRTVRIEATWPRSSLGDETIERFLDAHAFAVADPYRAATNNKGIMNGVDAVLIATGNDFRAAEAAAHAFAARGGYGPLAHYRADDRGLTGTLELPLPVGIVGGSIRTNPVAQVCLKLLDVGTAQELAQIAAAVGLANNFAAVRAMVTEGIQRGHMKLHANNCAVLAGATADEAHEVARIMVRERNVRFGRAQEILEQIRNGQARGAA